MKIHQRIITATVVSAFIAGSLASCSSTEQFAQAETADLPQSVVTDLGDAVDGSVRLLGEDAEGVSYYAGRWESEGDEQYCLVFVKSDSHSRACGGSFPITGVYQGIRATLDPAGIESEADGAESVGEYLVVSRP